MKALYFIGLVFIVLNANAQTPTVDDYEKKTILISNGKFYKANMIFDQKELVKEINAKSKEGAIFANDGAKDIKQAKTFSSISLGLIIGGVIYLNSSRNISINNNNRLYTYLGFNVGGIIFSAMGGIKRNKGNGKLAKAVWLYNRDVLFLK